MIQDTLNLLCEKQSLTSEQSEALFTTILNGDLEPLHISALLTALRAKGETTEEIIGAVRAMRAKMVTVQAPADAIDTCGTGGDAKGTYNISTTVAIVAAACGIPVAKHGNRSVSSKSGSADVLEALGVKLDLNAEQLSQCLGEVGLCFMMAPLFHPAMKEVGATRKALGIRTIFNILGPLLNPASSKRQLIGVFSEKWLLPMAETLHQLGAERAMVVHGKDGLDELTVTTESAVCELKSGSIKQYTLKPEEYGLSLYDEKELAGGDAEANAEALKAVLSGESGAYRDAVLLNTAAALTVSGKAHSMLEGIGVAKEAIDSGKASETLSNLVTFTQKA